MRGFATQISKGNRKSAKLNSRLPLSFSSHRNQNVPSIPWVAADAFGFLIFSHAFDDPDLYGASSFFDTMPSSPRLQAAANILSPRQFAEMGQR